MSTLKVHTLSFIILVTVVKWNSELHRKDRRMIASLLFLILGGKGSL